MGSRSTWTRANNFDYSTGKMKNKYNFSFHLREVGDWIESGPLSFEERRLVTDAVVIWAYRHKYQVKVRTVGVLGGRGIHITLTAKYR